jgi:uncharacterized protein (DUF934 family)
MSVIVTDTGFGPDTFDGAFVPLDQAGMGDTALHLAPDTDPARLPGIIGAEAISIAFPSFADGRGFTLARRLRHLGFRGRLRASGHVLSDQYAMARRAGFDEVEIPDELAARQPQDDWLFRADWRAHDHQARLRGQAAGNGAHR